jgi:hypothetical protein
VKAVVLEGEMRANAREVISAAERVLEAGNYS